MISIATGEKVKLICNTVRGHSDMFYLRDLV